MSDAAAHILREAKSLHQGLKDLLKTRETSDREIEIQRKNLRRQYLRLLFVHPYARESKDAETALWLQTSYSLIAIFKQRIAALDRAIQHPPRQGQQPNHPPRTVEYRKLLQRFRQFLAEEEKFWTQLILRIRRHFALDDAQSALTALGIVPEDEQTPAMLAAADTGATANASRRNQFQFPPELDAGTLDLAPTTPAQRDGRIAILSKALVYLGDIARYKEQYNESGGRPRAGHEDGPPAAAGRRGRRGGGPANHMAALPRLRNYDRAQSCYEQARMLLPHDGNPSHQLAILSSYQKDTFSSLVHYYRALCVRQPFDTASENMTNVLNKTLETYKSRGLLRERELLEEKASGAPPAPRVRVEAFKEKVVVLHAQWCMNIDEAKSMGERVIADFADLVADRILPIDMISKVVVLAQGALWKHRMVRRPSGHGDRRHTKIHTTESNIVTHLVATHRVLLTNGSAELAESPPEDAVEHDLAQRITATFRRTLPALRMAGKWLRANTRYISQARRMAAAGGGEDDGTSNSSARDATGTGRGGRDRRHSAAPPVVVGDLDTFWSEYARFCTTLLHLFPPEELPPLRTQLEEDVEMAGFLPLRKFMMGADGRATGTGSGPASTLGAGAGAGSVGGAGAMSPRDNSAPNGRANGDDPSTALEKERPVPRDQVHPNEEQLMRISDILTDAQAIAEDENTPIVFEEGSFIFKDDPAAHRTVGRQEGSETTTSNTGHASAVAGSDHSSIRLMEETPQGEPDDDDRSSIANRTDDDLLREVINAALSDPSEDDDADYIVYSPGVPLSPRQDAVVVNPISTPITPPRLNSMAVGPSPTAIATTPRRADPLSPPRHQLDLQQPQRAPAAIAAIPPKTTAKDLLNKALNMDARAVSFSQHSRGTSVPHVGFLFGSGGSSSIWSDTTENKPFNNPTSPAQPPSNGTSYLPPISRQPVPAFTPKQSPWVSPQPSLPSLPSLPWQTPLPPQGINTYQQQTTRLGSPLHAPFMSQQSAILNGSSHHRAPSETLPLARTHSYSQPAVPTQRYDPFGYDIPTPLPESLVAPLNGTLGRAPYSIQEQLELPTPSGPAGFGYPQNHIESAFYNAPNIEPPQNALRRERMMPSQYGPISPTSHIWSNTG